MGNQGSAMGHISSLKFRKWILKNLICFQLVEIWQDQSVYFKINKVVAVGGSWLGWKWEAAKTEPDRQNIHPVTLCVHF